MEPTIEPQQTTTSEQSTEKKKVNISIPAAIVTGAAIIGIAIMLSSASKAVPQQGPVADQKDQITEVAKTIATIRSNDYVRGSDDAQVVVIEYSDSDCPFCKQFHDTMNKVITDYNGKVSWVYRFFPLETLHPNAIPEALSLYCAGELGGEKTFWSYLDQIIGVTLAADTKSKETLIALASQQGLDRTLLATCMESNAAKARVTADTEEAKSIGARGTPFSIAVHRTTGKQVIIPGALPLESVKEIIDSLLQ